MGRAKSTTARKSVSKPAALSKTAVIEAIRQAILANNLVPGQRLVEAELCQLLGASRGTVRSALMDLVHEGMVERIANKGARVRIVGLEEALHIAEVRMAVESLCVARAAERVTNEQVKLLRNIAKSLSERAKQNDAIGFADLTHRLFELYVNAADQPVAAEILERLRARNTRHGFRLTFRPGRAQTALPYWLDLIDAICKRDADAATEALRRHAKNVHDTMEELAHERGRFDVHRHDEPPAAKKRSGLLSQRST